MFILPQILPRPLVEMMPDLERGRDETIRKRRKGGETGTTCVLQFIPRWTGEWGEVSKESFV